MGLLIKHSLVGCTILMLFEGVEPLRRATVKTPLRQTPRWQPTMPRPVPWAKRMSEYNCHLWKTCLQGGPQACAWDERWLFLAWFRDICAMYQVNCESNGRHAYIIQNNAVCKMKSEFIGSNKQISETDLPTIQTTATQRLHGINRTKEWWWDGSTTNQYQYLNGLEVDRGK
ncbi:uncharacterized protein LOC133534015 [Cydia pomonella]|uniref:uncharacterized protein LOC133534015 n=1 Tax=Cydia pomonella TaxID=82600 RepID=UPI002ADDDA62|nr:uncharacterized protein LOC133534015 [Cydia pomonella]